ncbi:hypothetical protein LQ938_00835 [Microbacterium sp. cx-55]|uniref:hypothetical protein n=1 Tax=Microbacterium sp. cx-55 TaxID=2875948 RepID=UPI001CBB17C3|nr:hypothetical protein [Microbacterium sp. cx-55]MBZ4487351.1 hypothetical protein [Microbacterium sp. cx-55]UGB35371.1 hypothetical protein LQ938_00835 [Microbacterium sp. cx-55]
MAHAHSIPRTFVLFGAVALAGLGLTACAPEAAPTAPTATATATASASASPTGSSEASPAPTDAAASLDWPDTALASQIGVALFNPPGSDPAISTGQSIAGPALAEAGRTIRITAECAGSRMQYELRTAQVDEDQRVLFTDTVACGTPSTATFTGLSYSGPVQLAITNADAADAGWVQATLAP